MEYRRRTHHFKGREIIIGSTHIPIPDDEIVCDVCNEIITGDIIPVESEYALCDSCYARNMNIPIQLVPFCKASGSQTIVTVDDIDVGPVTSELIIQYYRRLKRHNRERMFLEMSLLDKIKTVQEGEW